MYVQYKKTTIIGFRHLENMEYIPADTGGVCIRP